MNILTSLFNKSSASQARNRLMVVCATQRQGLPPQFMEDIKGAVLDVLKRYPQFDLEDMDVNLNRDNESDAVSISIPFSKTHMPQRP